MAADFGIDGFQTIIQKTKGKVRTIMLVKDEFKPSNATDPTNLPSSTVQVKFEDCGTLLISSIYRQWSTMDPENELDELKDILANRKRNSTVIMGDFNLDAAMIQNKSYRHKKLANQLTDICTEFGLNIKSGGPTYSHPNGTSSLDFFLISENIESRAKVVPFGNSDHDAALLTIQAPLTKEVQKKQITIRSTIKNEAAFKDEVLFQMSGLANELIVLQNPNDQADRFIETFSAILNKHAPFVTKTFKNRKPKHALSKETLEARKERNTARNALMHCSSSQRKVKMKAFKKIRNKVNSLIKRDRTLKAEFDLKSGKNVFQIAENLLGKTKARDGKIELLEDGKLVTKEEEVARTINDFFIQKIRDLKAKINLSNKKDPVQRLGEVDGSFNFQLVSIDHVEKIVDRLKKSNSCGFDGISSKTLKIVKTEVAPVISLIINTSFCTGIYPDQFKIAKIIPIFKNKGCKNDKRNYRPVSNLSTVGKVVEVAATIQITRYCERMGILGAHQHGFRRGRSTTSAITSSLIKWQEAKERKKYTGCLLYDLSAAYDTLSPEILVQKAKLQGFDKNSCHWLESFTTGRYQAVVVGQSTSELRKLDCGVPQGSPLSCVLFLLYVGDLPKWVSAGNVQGYADDTIHFVTADSLEEAKAILEEESRNIFSYFTSNELVANPAKTAFLMFCPGKPLGNKVCVTIGGATIEESESERILGIQVNWFKELLIGMNISAKSLQKSIMDCQPYDNSVGS